MVIRSNIRLKLLNIPIYIYLILFVISSLNFAMPFIMDTNQKYGHWLIEVSNNQIDISLLEETSNLGNQAFYQLMHMNNDELTGYIMQMQVIQIMLNVIQSFIYVMFILMVLVVAMQFISRRAIKFKMAFKYAILSLLFSSFVLLLLLLMTFISSVVLTVVGLVLASCFYGWLCFSELKMAMTKDYLGEEHTDYGIY